TWRKDSLLAEISGEIRDFLNAKGGVMTSAELASALLTAHGTESQPPQAEQEAMAVLRAAVEAEADRKDEDPWFIVQRTSGQRVIIARCMELADYAQRLAKKADQLAAADPLPSEARVVAELNQIQRPVLRSEMPSPDDSRRAHLAAAASETAAVNNQLEIYPRNLPAERAFKLAFGAIMSRGDLLQVDQIRERIRSRYPQAQPLPEMPELATFIQSLASSLRVKIVWDATFENGKGCFRIEREPPLTVSSATVINRKSTIDQANLAGGGAGATAPADGASGSADGSPLEPNTHAWPRAVGGAVPAISAEDVSLVQFEQKLQSTLKEGGYLVLTTTPSHLAQAEAELCRRFPPTPTPASSPSSASPISAPTLVRLSVEQLLLHHMKRLAHESEVDWAVVLEADNAGPGSSDWNQLMGLVAEAIPSVEADVRAAGGAAAGGGARNTVLLTYAGLLGRYQQVQLLSSLQSQTGRAGGLHGLWLLLPTDEQNLPTIMSPLGPLPVPVMHGQHCRVPSGWIGNKLRGGPPPLSRTPIHPSSSLRSS
ncbi:MAG: hypothetical protein NTV94_05030, partial [Planctomycetota bacterium]|nr:hypothetical protein [Planctomycetota bacterium]